MKGDWKHQKFKDPETARKALRKAIRSVGGRHEDLARRMGVPRGQVTYYLNNANEINLEKSLEIEEATSGEVDCLELADHLSEKLKRRLRTKRETVCAEVLSVRVQKAIESEKFLQTRKKGRPETKSCENFHTLKGRTEAIAAQEIGLGNYQTYRQAKKILKGTPELVAAMDARRFRMNRLYQIAKESLDQQRQLLAQSDADIIHYLKQKYPTRKTSTSPLPNSVMREDPSITLAQAFIGLTRLHLILSNPKGEHDE